MENWKELRHRPRNWPADINEIPSYNVVDHMEKNIWLPILITVASLLAILFICLGGCAYSATLDQWADNIRIVEGVNSHYPYGIKSIHARNDLEARKICKNTVRRNFERYCRKGGNPHDLRAYIYYLADVYCPKIADLKGNIRWKKNMIALMNRKGAKK